MGFAEVPPPLKWDEEHTEDMTDLLAKIGRFFIDPMDARVCKECRKGRTLCDCAWRRPPPLPPVEIAEIKIPEGFDISKVKLPEIRMGMGVGNVKSIAKLDIYKGDEPLPVAEQMTEFVRSRMAAMLKYTDAWGRPDAVELQFLLMVEMALVLQGKPLDYVYDALPRYVGFIGERVSHGPTGLAHKLGLEHRANDEFVAVLREFAASEGVVVP